VNADTFAPIKGLQRIENGTHLLPRHKHQLSPFGWANCLLGHLAFTNARTSRMSSSETEIGFSFRHSPAGTLLWSTWALGWVVPVGVPLEVRTCIMWTCVWKMSRKRQ
jgi:hypothetical protein